MYFSYSFVLNNSSDIHQTSPLILKLVLNLNSYLRKRVEKIKIKTSFDYNLLIHSFTN